MLRNILLVILTICSISCEKKSTTAKLGEPVPNYTFTNVLNSKESEVSIRDLKGKIVVLEFWATWCSPCLPAMKMLDSLQSEFKNDMEVIAVSTESKERIEKYVKSTNTILRIVSDTLHSLNFKYKVIPHSIIIDKNGIVRAITSPENISREIINKLIIENEISLDVKDDFYIDPNLKISTIKSISNPNYTIELRSFEQQKRGINYLTDIDGVFNGVEMWNRTIPGLYMTLFDVPTFNRMVYKDGLNEEDFPWEKEHRFSLNIQTSTKYQNNWKQLGINVLNENFDVNAKMIVDTLDCYVLKKSDHSLKQSNSDESEYSFMGSIFEGKKIKISNLIEYLEEYMELPIVDMTSLDGEYDIEFEWQEEDPKTLHTELKKYGLKLKKSENKLPVKVMAIYKKK